MSGLCGAPESGLVPLEVLAVPPVGRGAELTAALTAVNMSVALEREMAKTSVSPIYHKQSNR